MAVEPKKKKLRPNERFVWGPQPWSWPEVFLFDGNFWWGKKSLTKQWWTVALFQHFLFWGGGMEMPTNSEQVYVYFFPWWNSAGVDENPSQKKTMVEITLKVVSLTIAEIQMLKMFQCGWNEMTANFTSIFGGTLIFTFMKMNFTTPDGWNPVKRWNWGVADWPLPRIPGTTKDARGDGGRRCRDQTTTAGVDTEDGECTDTGSAEG